MIVPGMAAGIHANLTRETPGYKMESKAACKDGRSFR